MKRFWRNFKIFRAIPRRFRFRLFAFVNKMSIKLPIIMMTTDTEQLYNEYIQKQP